jgi:hypothetical protein
MTHNDEKELVESFSALSKENQWVMLLNVRTALSAQENTKKAMTHGGLSGATARTLVVPERRQI